MIQIGNEKSCRKQKGWPHNKVSYLTATCLEELQAFAKKIRVDKKHFRPHPTCPRYNLSPPKRAVALKRVLLDTGQTAGTGKVG